MKKIIVLLSAIIALVTTSFAEQCMATTKKGTQCKRQVQAGALYCYQHNKGEKVQALKVNEQVSKSDKHHEKTDAQAKKNVKMTVSGDKKAQVGTEKKDSVKVLTASERVQCSATTKKGRQCRRMAKEGSDKCWQHQK